MSKVSSFFETITPEILTPAEYVDWDKIRSKIRDIRRETALLHSLDLTDPESDLSDLLNKHPRILLVLKLLVAHTPDVLLFRDRNKYVDFRKDLRAVAHDRDRARAIADIFGEMGLFDFLKEVRSVEDVLKGVLIGLEPNVRKNRRGYALEQLTRGVVMTSVSDVRIRTRLNIMVEAQMTVDLEHEKKKVDYVVLVDDVPRVAIEVNFYSTSGSKPSEVLTRAYPDAQNNLRKAGMGLIVLTDGIGWEKMKPVISTAFGKLDHLMNMKQAKEGALADALLGILGHNRNER